MSDATIGIEVTANTSAAVRALRDLEDATTAATDAADAAGEGQKTLAQQTARAKEMQLAANEAVKRAQTALAEHNDTVRAHGRDSKEAAASLARLKAAQEAAAAATAKSEKALEAVAEQTAKAVSESDKLTPVLARVAKEVKSTGQQSERAASDLRRLDLAIISASKSADTGGATLASFAGNLGANAVSALAGRLGDLGLHAIGTAANFERLKTALATTLGSTEAANEQFAELQAFAAATPFSLEEVTNGFLKLKNRGLDASAKALTAYGNTASAMGKSLDDMIEAVADAASGENERLKEFGIVGSKAGDKVTYTFRGMAKEVAFSSKEIEKHLISLGEANFSGGMEAQSRTLGGLWSTVKDGFDQFIVGIMDSGITSSMKDLMGTFSGMSETGKLLSDILSVTLGGAFTIVAGTVKGAAAAVELMATGLNYLMSPIHTVVDAAKPLVDDVFGALAVEARRVADEHAALAASIEPVERGTGTLVDRFLTAQDAALGYTGSLWDQARALLEVEASSKKAADASEAMWAKLQKKQDDAQEAAAFAAFEKANTMGPELPPGFKPPKKGGKVKPEKVTRLDNAELRDITRQGMVDPMQEAERARAALEAEEALREKRLVGIDREIAALEARGIAEAEQVDMIFSVVEVESEAARQREALIDQRLASEARLARWQAGAAKNAEDREKALTRMERVEHERRLVTLRRAADEEAATHRKREKVVSAVTGAVTQLSETMVEGIERAAKGERGAVAEMIGELLKGVAKKHAILAVGETALGVGAAASYRYAAAAQHFAAAGLHTGVAVAAGAGAYAAGQVAASRGGGSETMGASGSSGSGTATSSPRRREDGDLEAQQTPISHEQLRRGDASASTARSEGGVQIHINSPTINGAGGLKEFAHMIRREFDRQDRGGYRPRL